MRYEKGKWPAHNVTAIVNNVKLVFKSGDINKLNGTAYRFIITHMSFIAHYSLYGFRQVYEDLGLFAKTLQTSEYSESYDYNPRWADKVGSETDEYGPGYNKSISDTIRGIVAAAQDYLNHGSSSEKTTKPRKSYRPTKGTRRTHSKYSGGAMWGQLGGISKR